MTLILWVLCILITFYKALETGALDRLIEYLEYLINCMEDKDKD